MRNFLCNLFMLFFVILMTLIMLPISLVIIGIDLICDVFESSDEDEQIKIHCFSHEIYYIK